MPISCEQCRDNWDELLNQPASDSGFVASKSDDISQHLASCAECTADFKIIRAARRELQALPVLQAPSELRVRIREQLQSEATPQMAAAPVMQVRTAATKRDSWFSQLSRFFQRPANVAWSSGLALAAFCVFVATRNPTTPPLQSGTEMASVQRDEETAKPREPAVVRTLPRNKVAPKSGAVAKKPALAPPPALPRTELPTAESPIDAAPSIVAPPPQELRPTRREQRDSSPSASSGAKAKVTLPPVPLPSIATAESSRPAAVAQTRATQQMAPQKPSSIRVVWLPKEARSALSRDRSDAASLAAGSVAANSAANGNRMESHDAARSETMTSENGAATMMTEPGADTFSSNAAGATPFESPDESASTTMMAPAPAPAPGAPVVEVPAETRFRADANTLQNKAGISTMDQLPTNHGNAAGTGLQIAPPRLAPSPGILHRSGTKSQQNRGGGASGDTSAEQQTIRRQKHSDVQSPAPEDRTPARSNKEQASPTPQISGSTIRRARLQVAAPRDIPNARIEVLLSNGLRWAQGSNAAQRVVWSGSARAGQVIPVEIAVIPIPARQQQFTVVLQEVVPGAIGKIIAPHKNSSASRRIIEQRTISLPAVP